MLYGSRVQVWCVVEGSADDRDLHYPLSRQRQMYIRNRPRDKLRDLIEPSRLRLI